RKAVPAVREQRGWCAPPRSPARRRSCWPWRPTAGMLVLHAATQRVVAVDRGRWGRRTSTERRIDMAGAITRGVLFVHSAPRALCPHVEWAAGGVLGARVAMDWTEQPAAPGMFRAEYSWQGVQGTGARLTSALRGWTHLRYEVTEEA